MSQCAFTWFGHEWVSLSSFYFPPDHHSTKEIELESISDDEVPGK
jgi:hypothetical protein